MTTQQLPLRPELLMLLMFALAPLWNVLREAVSVQRRPFPRPGYRVLLGHLFYRQKLRNSSSSVAGAGVAPAWALTASLIATTSLPAIIAPDGSVAITVAIPLLGWLLLSRLAIAMAAADAGSLTTALGVGRERATAIFAEPTLLLALLTASSRAVTPGWVLAAVAFAVAAWSYGSQVPRLDDSSGFRLGLLEWSLALNRLTLWLVWILAFLPPTETIFGSEASDALKLAWLLITLAMVATAVSVIEDRVVKTRLRSPRHLPLAGLALAILAVLASTLSTATL